MNQQSFLEFIAHLNYMMSAATIQVNLQSRAPEANAYVQKYIDPSKAITNSWHLILEDAIKLREDRSIKARTIANEIVNNLKDRRGFGYLIEDIELTDKEIFDEMVQSITNIIKKELENG